MARIPKFQQRKLASEIVGTPGVDTSAQTNFRNAAAAVQLVADKFGRIAVKRQVAVDKASANDTLIDFQIALQKAAQQQATQFAGSTTTPAERVELLKTKSDQLFNSFEDSLATPEAKALFAAGAQTTIRRRLLDEGKIASDNQVLVANDRMVTAQNKIAGSLYEFAKDVTGSYQGKKDELLFTTQEGSLPNIEVSRSILGDKQSDDFAKKSLEGNFRAVLAGMLEIAPEEAIQLLEDPDFSEVLTQKEHDAKLREAKKRAIDFTKLVQIQEQHNLLTERSELLGKLRDKTLTLGEVEQIGDTVTQEAFRKALLEYNPLTPEKLAERASTLQLKWEALVKRDRDDRLTTELKDNIGIDDIVRMQVDYINALRDGVITKDRLIKAGQRYPDMFRQALDNQNPGLFRWVMIGIGAFEGPATLIAGSKGKEADQNRAELTDAYLDKIDGFTDLDFDDVEKTQAVIKEVIMQFQFDRNSNRARYIVGDEVATPSGVFKISGFDDDGEPMGDFI